MDKTYWRVSNQMEFIRRFPASNLIIIPLIKI